MVVVAGGAWMKVLEEQGTGAGGWCTMGGCVWLGVLYGVVFVW